MKNVADDASISGQIVPCEPQLQENCVQIQLMEITAFLGKLLPETFYVLFGNVAPVGE